MDYGETGVSMMVETTMHGATGWMSTKLDFIH
jgi:hypothetical protein